MNPSRGWEYLLEALMISEGLLRFYDIGESYGAGGLTFLRPYGIVRAKITIRTDIYYKISKVYYKISKDFIRYSIRSYI
jgi:hypothetical protein